RPPGCQPITVPPPDAVRSQTRQVPSSLTVITLAPSGLKVGGPAQLRTYMGGVTGKPLVTSHTRQCPSPATNNQHPSGLNVAQLTPSECTNGWPTGSSEPTSQRRTVWLRLVVTTQRSSGLNVA